VRVISPFALGSTPTGGANNIICVNQRTIFVYQRHLFSLSKDFVSVNFAHIFKTRSQTKTSARSELLQLLSANEEDY
jgi:hypothetical protein